jgi:hypothetical protein
MQSLLCCNEPNNFDIEKTIGMLGQTDIKGMKNEKVPHKTLIFKLQKKTNIKIHIYILY